MTKKVLHVDDDREWRDSVRKALQKVCQLSSFSSLSEAKVEADSCRFDLCIVDGNVDGAADGWEWAEKLRKKGQTVCILSTVRIESEVDFYDKRRWESESERLRDYVQKLSTA